MRPAPDRAGEARRDEQGEIAMHETTTNHRANSVSLEPFSRDELYLLRRRARRPDRFNELAREVLRLQVLRTFCGTSVDLEARLGASRAEGDALAALARACAPDREALRLKAGLFASCEDADDNLSAMLAASLRADASRLGVGATADIPEPRMRRRPSAETLRTGFPRRALGRSVEGSS